MSTAQNAQQLAQTITDDIPRCESLVELLNSEREALKDKDIEQLETILKNKDLFLSQLESSARLRAQLVSTMSVNASPEETVEALIKNTHSDTLRSNWKKLKGLLKTCHEQNEINGKIMSRNKKTYGKLLEILRGQSQAPNLYTQKGAASARSSGYQLGEA